MRWPAWMSAPTPMLMKGSYVETDTCRHAARHVITCHHSLLLYHIIHTIELGHDTQDAG